MKIIEVIFKEVSLIERSLTTGKCCYLKYFKKFIVNLLNFFCIYVMLIVIIST